MKIAQTHTPIAVCGGLCTMGELYRDSFHFGFESTTSAPHRGGDTAYVEIAQFVQSVKWDFWLAWR